MKTKELYTVMFPSYPDIVDVAQMQKMLSVSRHLAYELITSGKVQGIKVGKAYRVPKVKIIDFVLSQRKEG
ncbi:helix-turn-helix domain-containing protein [Ruminococcaceae bacterium OttesenSCG-928-O06]|nr:helix-turn-helix domain-containing protein [Ruminococcaceae bacterium OttesenSCG-928-O06]